jgi:hypothetical protein
MKKYFKIFISMTFVLCVFSASASAESLTVDEFTQEIFSGLGTFTSNGEEHGSATAAMKIEMLDANGNPMNGEELFTGFCVDPLQPISTGQKLTVGMTSIENVVGGLQAAWLFDTIYTDDLSAQEVAGLQFALWEVTSGDTNYSLSEGNFYANITNESIEAYANSYLEGVPASISADDLSALYMISQHPENQDLIVKMPKPEPVPTPEPATMMLMGLGLLGLFGLSRKNKK